MEQTNSFLILFLAPVREFLENDDVSEILINGPNQIYIERKGKLEKTSAQFVSEASLRAAASNIAKSVGRLLNEGAFRYLTFAVAGTGTSYIRTGNGGDGGCSLELLAAVVVGRIGSRRGRER